MSIPPMTLIGLSKNIFNGPVAGTVRVKVGQITITGVPLSSILSVQVVPALSHAITICETMPDKVVAGIVPLPVIRFRICTLCYPQRSNPCTHAAAFSPPAPEAGSVTVMAVFVALAGIGLSNGTIKVVSAGTVP